MPSQPNPIIGPLGVVWTPIWQAAQVQKQKAADLAGAKQQQNIYDGFYNCVKVGSTNMNQVVTIGAAHAQGGVEVWTGIANGTAGDAVQTALALGTLTVTKGSTAATLASTTHGTFTGGGNVIGAVDTTGKDVLSPYTTYTISGTAVTLSIAAQASGTALYCASAVFAIVT